MIGMSGKTLLAIFNGPEVKFQISKEGTFNQRSSGIYIILRFCARISSYSDIIFDLFTLLAARSDP